jgi:hypothetical protein
MTSDPNCERLPPKPAIPDQELALTSSLKMKQAEMPQTDLVMMAVVGREATMRKVVSSAAL